MTDLRLDLARRSRRRIAPRIFEKMLDALVVGESALVTSPPPDVIATQDENLSFDLSPDKRRSIQLSLDEESNWVLGVLGAWTEVIRVLDFYQERLLEEGYLRTAREEVSVHEMVRLIHYRPRPGVSGSVFLAFQVDERVDRLEIPLGMAVQGVPPTGGDVLSFEAGESFEARAAWNLLSVGGKPDRVIPRFDPTSTEMFLEGISFSLLPRSGLLFLGLEEDSWAAFRRIGEVEVVPGESADDPSRTRVTWEEELRPKAPEAEAPEVEAPEAEAPAGAPFKAEVSVLREEARLFGYNAPYWSDVPLEAQRRARQLEGGVQMLYLKGSRRGARLEPTHRGLPPSAASALTFDSRGRLFAGFSGEGVFRLGPGEESWQAANRGLGRLEIISLASDDAGGLLAGSGDGELYRTTDGGELWTLLSGRSVATGRWSWGNRGRGRRVERLPTTPVRSLLKLGGSRTRMLAGTDSGIYLSDDLADSWEPSNRGLPGADPETGEAPLAVNALVWDRGAEMLWAGTSAGVFQSADRGKQWAPINRGLPATDPVEGTSETAVSALAVLHDPRTRSTSAWAGTARGLFHRGTDDVWKQVHQGLPGGAILCVTALVDPINVSREIFVGTERGLWRKRTEDDPWREIDLGPAQEVRALAAYAETAQLAAATPVRGFAEEEWPGFHLQPGRIDLDRIVSVTNGDHVVLRSSGLTEESAPEVGIFKIHAHRVIERNDFQLRASVSRLEIDPEIDLGRFSLRSTEVFFGADRLPLSKESRPISLRRARANLLEFLEKLGDVTGFARPTLVRGLDPDREIRVYPSTVGQLVDSLGQAEDEYCSIFAPDAEPHEAPAAPDARLDIRSLEIFGNVVEAWEGRTIYREILGDGVQAQANQTFFLDQPLAWRATSAGLHADLETLVQGEPWEATKRLLDRGPSERVFSIERNAANRSWLVFGDGMEGALLPTGGDNVVATYRTGATNQPIPSDVLTLMPNRPLGVASVTNPTVGTSGGLPETIDDARRNAPARLRNFGRVVALRDYENFALAYPGIVRARARSLVAQGERIVHLTVATSEGEDHRPAPGSLLLDQLVAALIEAQAGFVQVRVEPFRQVGLKIKAAIRIRSSLVREKEWERIEDLSQRALQAHFGFETSRFGGRISAGDIVRVLQNVDGVVAVDLREFDPRTSMRPIEVLSQPAWVNPAGTLIPAELVLLEHADLILEEEER